MHSSDHVWVIILAAGEGKRVLDLTYDRRGKVAPKQYSTLDGSTTLLDSTMERAQEISPPERIVAIVAAQHQSWWASELTEIPRENVIVQPENRGTAAGILLPLLWINRHDPDAIIVVLPSDHGVAHEETLRSAMIGAVSCVGRSEAGIVLLGVEAVGPETDYGWIVRGPGQRHGIHPVSSFHEKPDAATTASLFNQGALLNSFILVANGHFLLDLFKTRTPRLWCSFKTVLNQRWDGFLTAQETASLYDSIPALDFSREILERATESLWVYPVPACGWLDLGTPERLLRHLNEHSQSSWDSRAQPTAEYLRWKPDRAPRSGRTHLATSGITNPRSGLISKGEGNESRHSHF